MSLNTPHIYQNTLYDQVWSHHIDGILSVCMGYLHLLSYVTPKNPSKPWTLKTPPKTPKPYADKLGKDGKLTQKERQHRFTNNLCLFCGSAGHTADICPKKSAAAKGRAAQVAEAPAVLENPLAPRGAKKN